MQSWDGTVQESPDDREKQSVTESADAFASRKVTRTSNLNAAISASPGLSSGKITTVTKGETLSGIHDGTVEEETPVASSYDYTFTVKSRGRSGTATVYVYHNQTEEPTVADADGYEVRPSLRVNRHGLWDGMITKMPTFYGEETDTVNDSWSETKKWLEARRALDPGTDSDGNEYRLVTEESDWKETWAAGDANDFAAGGKSGSDSGRSRKGLYWGKKVTDITYGDWADTKAGAE
jgi:hypothetical protein